MAQSCVGVSGAPPTWAVAPRFPLVSRLQRSTETADSAESCARRNEQLVSQSAQGESGAGERLGRAGLAVRGCALSLLSGVRG